jgi:hypothetical protein
MILKSQKILGKPEKQFVAQQINTRSVTKMIYNAADLH